MITVRLGDDLENRLQALANVTGRTKTFYLKKLVQDHLEDLEDLYVARHRIETLGETSSLEDVRKRLGLED